MDKIKNWIASKDGQSALEKFTNNKYRSWYLKIIDKNFNYENNISTEYCEKHHILPVSLGGSDEISNIIKISAKCHFILHKLLIKITKSKDKTKMYKALLMFTKNCPNTIRRGIKKINSKIYAEIRNDLGKQKIQKFEEILNWCKTVGHLPRPNHEDKYYNFYRMISDSTHNSYNKFMMEQFNKFPNYKIFKKIKKIEDEYISSNGEYFTTATIKFIDKILSMNSNLISINLKNNYKNILNTKKLTKENYKNNRFNELLDYCIKNKKLPDIISELDPTIMETIKNLGDEKIEKHINIQPSSKIVSELANYNRLKYFQEIIEFCIKNGHTPQRNTKGKSDLIYYRYQSVMITQNKFYPKEFIDQIKKFPDIIEYNRLNDFIEALNWCEKCGHRPTMLSSNYIEKRHCIFIGGIIDINSRSYSNKMANEFLKFPTLRQFKYN